MADGVACVLLQALALLPDAEEQDDALEEVEEAATKLATQVGG